MKSWPKVKLGQVQVSSNIAQNHSSSPKEIISVNHVNYWPQFTRQEKCTKSEIRSSWSQFEHCSESLAYCNPMPHSQLLKFSVLKSWHIRGRLISRFTIKIISRFPTQMLCFPTQIKVGTRWVKDHQVLRLKHVLGLMEILKNLKRNIFV